MPISQPFTNQIRIPENHDWVVFILIGCLFLYILMFNIIERGANLFNFLAQKYYDSSNNLASWVITSCVVVLTWAILISQYVPIIPKYVADIQLFGYQLNKFGFSFWAITLFYLLKTGLGYIFFQSTGDSKKWSLFYFTATKFYFILSIILIILCVTHYYFPIDRNKAFLVYLYFFAFVSLFKVFFYSFHRNNLLPQKWYYKFLYICTLQLAPLMALWKLLFF